jgi:rod shape-determining protein MreC
LFSAKEYGEEVGKRNPFCYGFTMNFFNFNLKKAFVVLCILAFPLISINSQKDFRDTGWFNQPFTYIAGAMENFFFNFSDGVRGTTALYLDLISIKKEAARILAENKELRARQSLLDELQNENKRLNSLLDFKSHTKMDLVAARVIARDLLSDHNTVQINKGSQHGLKAGMAVISTEGVVGYIFQPELYTAKILLITDRFAVVDGLVARSRARGIVEGKNQGACVLRYVEKSEDILVGDIIVTSGIDNIFPKGFPVARVESIETKSYSVSLRVDLRPVVDPDKIEEVFIILNAANEDLSNKVTMNTK